MTNNIFQHMSGPTTAIITTARRRSASAGRMHICFPRRAYPALTRTSYRRKCLISGRCEGGCDENFSTTAQPDTGLDSGLRRYGTGSVWLWRRRGQRATTAPSPPRGSGSGCVPTATALPGSARAGARGHATAWSWRESGSRNGNPHGPSLPVGAGCDTPGADAGPRLYPRRGALRSGAVWPLCVSPWQCDGERGGAGFAVHGNSAAMSLYHRGHDSETEAGAPSAP